MKKCFAENGGHIPEGAYIRKDHIGENDEAMSSGIRLFLRAISKENGAFFYGVPHGKKIGDGRILSALYQTIE